MTYEKFCNIMKKSRLLSRVTISNSGRRYCITDGKSSKRSVTISPSDDNMISVAFSNVNIVGYPFKSIHLASYSNTVVVSVPLRELKTSIDVNILLRWAIAECLLGWPRRNLLKRIWIQLIRLWQHFLIKFV